jgi:nucleoside-diphosphate-sugar epimerase
MAMNVFVTGGGGFVGSRLLPALRRREHSIIALDRSGSIRRETPGSADFQVVIGDLLDPAKYRGSLAASDIVLHLAASTGRATQEEHFRVNTIGTELLLEECQRAGVRKFLFVSSIAAAFPDTTHYYYAQAKVRAEEAVRRSTLRFAILRPTMVLGRGSPILSALEKLAVMPIIPVFGSGRTKVQPVYVEDLVEFILTVIDKDMFSNQTFEVGGPDVLTMEELLQSIRQARRGSDGAVVHVPFGLLLPALKAAEAGGLGRLLPLSVGQLSSFRYDGTVAPNPLYESRRKDSVDVRQMLSLSLDGTTAGKHELDRECRVFARHLLGCSPNQYVLGKYAEAHTVSPALSAGNRFDENLLRFARRHSICAKIADSYTCLFFPGALLRKKLVLLLAILESCPPFFRMIDDAVSGQKASLLIRLAFRGCIAAISALVGIVIFVPIRLALVVVDRRPR